MMYQNRILSLRSQYECYMVSTDTGGPIWYFDNQIQISFALRAIDGGAQAENRVYIECRGVVTVLKHHFGRP